MSKNIDTYTWFGRVALCEIVPEDGVTSTFTKLWLRNRNGEGIHRLILEGSIQISLETKIMVTVAKPLHEIVQIARAEDDESGLGYFCFFSRDIQARPFAIKLTHDVFEKHDHGFCPYCTDSSHMDHWWSMSPQAKRIYLFLNPVQPGQGAFLSNGIAAGAEFWETFRFALATGGIHSEFKIPTIRGWQNRPWKRTIEAPKLRGPIQKASAYLNRDELSELNNCPYIAIIKASQQEAGYEFKVTFYLDGGSDDDEFWLVMWMAATFEKWEDHTTVLAIDQTEVHIEPSFT